ncbi:TRAP transporter large permease [Acuticoccus sp. MNP-M23]|uniref:TRAP transporter large permease n=1 Tax=Acuticoccus sp. MNP-M23 TaxID=3072793 RepID=UPI0028160793|nr:TRAP transporter large permease [Acuticoccus sp. MNP-M23]WMS41459.1 TRAP transporter large permease [Acuticoccus sp. MNP-M23]
MEWYQALALLLGMVFTLMMLGMPVALAFLGANLVGAFIFMGGERGIGQLINNGFGAMTNFALVPIPLFLLMGELFFHTGLATRVFNGVDRLLGKLPARLSYVTVGGGTAFATLSGSSMGSTALLGSLMLPEMMKRGYSKVMAIGPILGTGGLAIIIPPSALAVLLATFARIDVGSLLLAGVIPGIILAGFYAALIYTLARINPDSAPAYEVVAMPWGDRIKLFISELMPMVAVVVLVITVMVTGWATPTEAAAFGCFGVVVLAAIYRCLTVSAFVTACRGALKVTLMSFLIIFGSSTFSQLLAFSGASSGFIGWATSMEAGPYTMLLIMFMILLILGMFMDQLSMLLLTVPIFFPLAAQLGFDPIWFGLIVLLALEISFTTPPFGLLLFVMKGVAPPGTTMREIYIAGFPFIACILLLVLLLVAFPGIALFLPNLGH